eukprot:TRINITY_DN12443_c0_g1_i1.p1 TRINITY_DN12443_c0_g1~~TRINITY_DN12443_c0_g1_i1.p1  ORF type:complete len:336 (+),score=45.18 TRINITY_DN12443_c0_g1_i1:181-1188(+)
MSLRTSQKSDIRLPADIDWQMLDKSRFFVLGAALFSGVSGALYPAVVLKTRQQVYTAPTSCFSVGMKLLRNEGFCGMYKGFGTSLVGTLPARAMYMGALEITKSYVGNVGLEIGLPEATAATFANAAAGLSAAMAAQLVWTPVDVISQRLMVQDCQGGVPKTTPYYNGGFDAFRTIVKTDGLRGLYRGFGLSLLTYAPSNALWWASYYMSQRIVWKALRRGHYGNVEEELKSSLPGSMKIASVQALSAAMAGGVCALVTMPIDTIKTRLQVLDSQINCTPSVGETVKALLKEGGWMACYRGLAPRWASMSLSAATMVTTYEFLKRLSTKPQEDFV